MRCVFVSCCVLLFRAFLFLLGCFYCSGFCVVFVGGVPVVVWWVGCGGFVVWVVLVFVWLV
jgi:hypothetical protein